MHKSMTLILTLIIGFVLSIGALLVVREWETERARSQFDHAASQHNVIFQQRLSSILEAVESINAFYAASKEVTRDEFRRFTETELRERPAIQAFEWIPRVKAADRAAFEAVARKDGYQGFTFTERNSQGRMVPAGKRGEYFPVYFVEPYRGNEAALGFDLASNPARRAALERARDSGKLQATERITLVQEAAKSFGFLVFQPIYRNGTKTDTVEDRRQNLQGFALGVLRINDIAEIPASIVGGSNTKLNIFVFDPSAPADRQLLYPATAPFKTLAEIDSTDCVTISELVGGRAWTIAHCPPVGGTLLVAHGQSLFVLFLGLLLTGVTTAYVQSVANSRTRAANVSAELTQLIDTANAPIFGVNKRGRINEWNQAAARLTGYGKDEVLDCSLIDEFIPEEFKDQARAVLGNTLEGRATENYEMPILTKQGNIATVLVNSSPRRDIAGNIVGVIGIGQDITARILAEAQVIQAAKLATLGEMATSVAHELNQPLNVIRMAAGNVLRKMEKGDPDPIYLNDKLKRIASQTERAATIIDHMQMFGRKADKKQVRLDPRKAMQDAIGLMGEQLRLAEIDVSLILPETCPQVLGHKIPLEQVFLNLLTNARDAIQTAVPDGERKISMTLEATSINTVRIMVEDTGSGIPKKIINRIFEPFYTTKEIGQGTGLGLSVSYGIIRDMGGTIEAENVEGGARFTITLLVAETDAEKSIDHDI